MDNIDKMGILNEMEKIILEYLRNLKHKISIKKLSENINMSYPSTLKYVGTLDLKNKIKVYDFGNLKLVEFKWNENTHSQLIQ